MQDVFITVTSSGLRRLVQSFNNYILGNTENEALPLPAPESRFLTVNDREKLYNHIFERFSDRDEPDEKQPLCERVPNKLLREYKIFLQSVLARQFAHVYEHLRYITITEHLVYFVCDKYCWTAVLENDLMGINAEALQMVERLLDKGLFFKALHLWLNTAGEPDMADDAAISRAFFAFVQNQQKKRK